MTKKIWLAVGVLAVILVAWLWISYNSLVTANENVDSSWKQVETQYQRRFDLIPNLVAAVKGTMNQEQKVFGDLAQARANYSGAQTASDKAAAASQVENSLGRLLVIMENYPTLKSIDVVQTLMAQLEGTENRISVERSRFNDQVRDFNVMIKRFPMNILASTYGFSEKQYFNADTQAAQAPKVDLQITK
jgi:LemA protein